MRRASAFMGWLLLVLGPMILVGCDSNEPMAPPVGDITIQTEPDSISAPWQITRPDGFSQSGTGDMSLADLAVGSYTLTWGAVAGWSTPSPAVVTQTLTFGAVLPFVGSYLYDVVPPVEFASIPAGTFMMGSPTTEPRRADDETQHQVTLTHDLRVQTTEVTNQQYRDMAQWAYDRGYVTATSDSLFDNLDGSKRMLAHLSYVYCEIAFSGGTFTVDAGKASNPVMGVNWYGSAAYCDWVSLQQGLPRAYDHSTWQCNAGDPYTAAGYRLPTEAEWEYACRAGTQTPFNTGSCLDAGTEANYYGWEPYPGCPTGSAVGWTVPVGSYPANAFGLYDMHGNLREWCNDRYGVYGATVTDPVGAETGSYRVLRDGWYSYYAEVCRSASRYSMVPYIYANKFGFRPVRSAS